MSFVRILAPILPLALSGAIPTECPIEAVRAACHEVMQ
jgi:hypothetical protein